MNALIFTENNDLKITKTNGLRYEFNNVDKPSLGFDFDIIVYDGDEHWRIEKFDDSQDFETHERIDLTDEEMESIEVYIDASEPPQGVCLNDQLIDELYEFQDEKNTDAARQYGFDSLLECSYIGRHGSNHPKRTNARLVMECADATAHVTEQLVQEIEVTSEDALKTMNEYRGFYPDLFKPAAQD
jgi:hypothetical protein